MPICTHCTHPVPYLYTLYQSVNNLRLEQCPECRAFADPYVEHDPLTLFLDLILFKREVYRHLLFNRGCEPHHPNLSGSQAISRQPRSQRSWIQVIQLDACLVLLDIFIRWQDAGHLGISFTRLAIACFLDIVVFHMSVTLACVVLLEALKRYNKRSGRLQPQNLGTRGEFRTPLVSLTLFYSSFSKFFLLLLLAIWQPSAHHPSISPSMSGAGLPQQLAHHHLTQRLLSILDEDRFDRAWVIRNVLGGMSAGFGLRVLLDCHPVLTTLVVLFGWFAKSLVIQFMAKWTGTGVISEYSIP